MAILHKGELKVGNEVSIISGSITNILSGVVTDRINIIIFTGDDECYLGYRYYVRCNGGGFSTWKTVQEKYGDPMTIDEYKAYYRTPEAKAKRYATYKNKV